jgi:hypothetical protein
MGKRNCKRKPGLAVLVGFDKGSSSNFKSCCSSHLVFLHYSGRLWAGFLCASVLHLSVFSCTVNEMSLLNMLQNTMLLNMPPDNHPSHLITNPSSSSSSSSLKTPLFSTLSPSPPLHHTGLRIPPASALPRLAPQNPPKHRDSRGSKTQPSQFNSSRVKSSQGKARHLIVRATAPRTPRQNIFRREKKKEKVVEELVETSRNSLVRVSQSHLPTVIPVVKKLHKHPRSQTATLEACARISLAPHLRRCRRCGDKRRLGTQRSAPRI